MKKAKKRRRSLFYPIYFGLLALAICAFALGLARLWRTLDDYEKALPVHVARAQERMFLERDFEALYAYEDPSRFPDETKQDYIRYALEQTGGKEITVSEARTGDADLRRYVVKLDGEPFAQYELAPSGQTSAYGSVLWTLASVKTNLVRPSEYFVTAPAEARVLVDGEALGEERVLERDLPVARMEYVPANAPKRTCTKYGFSRCFKTPSILVLSPDQVALDLARQPDGGIVAAMNYDDPLKAECEQRVFEIAKLIARYTSDDLDEARMLAHVVKDSPAYKALRAVDTQWFGKHEGYDFADMRSGRYLAAGEDCFVCDVSYRYLIANRDGTVRDYATSYVFCMIREREKWLLYNLANA